GNVTGTQLRGWCAARTLIRRARDAFPASPEKIRGPGVTVHEREIWGESWRLIHDLSEGSSQTWRLARTPGAEVLESRPEVCEQGLRRSDRGSVYWHSVQGGQSASHRRENRPGVLGDRGTHRLAGFIRQKQKVKRRVI